MGTPALSSLINPSLFRKPLHAEFPMLTRQLGETAPRPADVNVLTADPSGDIDSRFDAVAYHAQVQRLSLSIAYDEVAARVAQTADSTSSEVEAYAQQLTFEFFAESRTEELLRFSSRTGEVADGLGDAQQSTYLEASRRIAQRFSFSLSISGAALNGFAGASEQVAAAHDPEAMNQLLALANDALGETDTVLDKIFELLGDFFSNTDDDFQTRFQKLYDGLKSLGLLGSGSTAGQVRAQSFSLQLEFSFESVELVQVQQSDPIVLDLDDDGFDITHHNGGAHFDIRGDGRKARTAFVSGGDAFLAIDRNGNGRIDSGKELFGDQHGAANGFEELRKLDSNGDRRIDAADRDFDKLLVFRDNGNGLTEPGELLTLGDAGIAHIDLAYTNVNEAAAGGNRLAQRAVFSYADGRRGHAADALLNFVV